MPAAGLPPRAKTPRDVAVIWADRCTGCGACIEVCPVDCIEAVDPWAGRPGLQRWCAIDWARCIGCRLCLRLPGAPAAGYTLTVCPWDAISMVDLAALPAVVGGLGGPPEYAAAEAPRRAAAAAAQAELARSAR